MSSELAIQDVNLPAVVDDGGGMFDEMTKAGSFLPRIDLFSNAKKLVKSGAFPANHFGLTKGKDKVEQLDKELIAFPLEWRLKALDFTIPKKVKNCFDETTDDFKRIWEQSQVKMPSGEKNPCMAGPEFLMVIPKWGFVTFMLGSKSSKAIGKMLRALTKNRKFVKFTSYFKDTGDYQWQQLEVNLYEGVFDLPSNADMVKEINAFKAVKSKGTIFTEEPDEELNPDEKAPVEGERVR